MLSHRRYTNYKMKTLVTNAEIEELGESLVRKYIGNKKPPPRCIDIEGFIKDFMQLPLVYANIAEKDRDKIGFLSDGKYALRVSENGVISNIIYPAGTIVIDRYLLQPDQSGRRRFTISHEGAHVIIEQISLYPLRQAQFNRYFDNENSYTGKELREHFNLNEMQTDMMASVLLMPRFLVEHTLMEFHNGEPIPLFGSNVFRRSDKILIQQMADSMGVSYSALVTRLRTLKLLEYRCMSDFIETLHFGGTQ